MNIGIDIRSLSSSDRTGVGMYMVGLLNTLFEQDKKNQYILFYNAWKQDAIDFPDWDHSHVQIIKTRWPNKILSACLWLKIVALDTLLMKKMAQKRKLDVFFSPNLHFTNLGSMTKHMLIIHDLSYALHPRWYTVKQRVWHKMIKPKEQCTRADVIIVPSENTRQDVIDVYGIEEKKVHVLYPGVESNNIHERQKILDGEKRLHIPEKFMLFLGTLEPRKNIEGIIDGFKRSGIEKKGYTLLIVGSSGWKSKKLLQYIQKTPNVCYLGYVSEKEKQLLYTKAAVFVYPSLYEGFGMPVREALAHGTPVITSHRSSLPEIGAGQVVHVDPYNSEEIADALSHILEKKQKKAHDIPIAASSVVETMTWKKAVDSFLQICTLLK